MCIQSVFDGFVEGFPHYLCILKSIPSFLSKCSINTFPFEPWKNFIFFDQKNATAIDHCAFINMSPGNRHQNSLYFNVWCWKCRGEMYLRSPKDTNSYRSNQLFAPIWWTELPVVTVGLERRLRYRSRKQWFPDSHELLFYYVMAWHTFISLNGQLLHIRECNLEFNCRIDLCNEGALRLVVLHMETIHLSTTCNDWPSQAGKPMQRVHSPLNAKGRKSQQIAWTVLTALSSCRCIILFPSDWQCLLRWVKLGYLSDVIGYHPNRRYPGPSIRTKKWTDMHYASFCRPAGAAKGVQELQATGYFRGVLVDFNNHIVTKVASRF